MKKRITALALACMASLGAFTGCGEEKTPEGEYCPINGLKNHAEEFRDDLDDGLEEVKDECDKKDNSIYRNIIFEEGEFKAYSSNNGLESYYSGSFDVDDDGEISFEYEKRTLTDSDGEKVTYKFGDEDESRQAKAVLTDMDEMNQSDTFYDIVKPSYYYNDKYFSYGIYPYFIASNRGTQRSTPVTLIKKGSFLCVETYGMELDGKYKQGKKFTINFDAIAPFEDDKYAYSTQSGDREEEEAEKEEYLDRMKDAVGISIDCRDDFETEIEFSDGEWEWYNASGELINSGEYQESEEYEGLIEMYMTESSPKYDEVLQSFAMPILLYINDGEIYYPGFIKLD